MGKHRNAQQTTYDRNFRWDDEEDFRPTKRDKQRDKMRRDNKRIKNAMRARDIEELTDYSEDY